MMEGKKYIGVLIGENEQNKPVGNLALIKSLTQEAEKYGAILFAFTPQAVNNHQINGFFYHKKSGNWLKMSFPIPEVVYNRTPSRREEQNSANQDTIFSLKSLGIPIFNPHFFNKNEVYEAFWANSLLQKHIPVTTKFYDYKQLHDVLNAFHRLYVKPSSSYKGDGIFTLEKSDNYLYKSNHSEKAFATFQDLSRFLENQLNPNEEYLLQQYIEKVCVDNRPFDLRVIVHRFGHRWHVTGIGIRRAGPGNVTTHVPSGGEILSEEMLPIKINRSLVEKIAKNCGEQLNSCFGPVKEFTLDIGVDVNGDYWIFEANSRPMAFDEPNIKRKIPVNLMKALMEECKNEAGTLS